MRGAGACVHHVGARPQVRARQRGGQLALQSVGLLRLLLLLAVEERQLGRLPATRGAVLANGDADRGSRGGGRPVEEKRSQFHDNGGSAESRTGCRPKP